MSTIEHRARLKGKIVSGFNPKIYSGYAIKEIPISLIDEPRRVTTRGLQGYRSVKRVRDYARMLKTGETPPPIELIKVRLSDGRLLKKPFTIYNGEHRYGAAVLACRQTMLAVIGMKKRKMRANSRSMNLQPTTTIGKKSRPSATSNPRNRAAPMSARRHHQARFHGTNGARPCEKTPDEKSRGCTRRRTGTARKLAG